MGALRRELGAVVLAPFYPASQMLRVVNDDTGLQADFMPVVHGVRSFEGLRGRSTTVTFGGATLLVADLEDAALAALEREGDAALRAQIRRLLALPMNLRTHFLRKRLPGGGSAA